MLLCLNDKYNYKAICNGKSIPVKKVFDGLYVVTISLGDKENGEFSVEVLPAK